MDKKSHHGEYISPFLIIFTDLDGTLLDAKSYSWEPASFAMERCKALGVPIIPVTSKTRAEMMLIMEELDIHGPFITENGGGIFIPVDQFPEPPPEAKLLEGLCLWPLGTCYADLVNVLRDIRKESGIKIRGFSDMSLEEISRLTGLGIEKAKLARQREFDEPFIIDNGDQNEDKLHNMVSKRGLSISKGGRFYHLHGPVDKGIAVEKLISWFGRYYKDIISVALGDSPNDFPMLKQADFAVLVDDKEEVSQIRKEIPNLIVTQDKGPEGWNTAVLDILRKMEEKTNA